MVRLHRSRFLTGGLLAVLAIGSAVPLSTQAAGTDISGGGNAEVCFDIPSIPQQIRERDASGRLIDPTIRNGYIPHITSITMLDLKEAQFKKGLGGNSAAPQLILPTPNETYESYARRLFDRLSLGAPQLRERFLTTMAKMPASEAIGQPDGLFPVDDYKILWRIDSTNCVVGTIAVHQILNRQFTMRFDERLMYHPKHPVLSRYVAYTHEVVYATLRNERDEKDSQNTIMIVGALLRKDLPASELLKVIRATDVRIEIAHGRIDRLGQDLNLMQKELLQTVVPVLNRGLVEFSGMRFDQLLTTPYIFSSRDMKSFISNFAIYRSGVEVARALPEIMQTPLPNISAGFGDTFYETSDYLGLWRDVMKRLVQMSQNTNWRQRESAEKAKAFLQKFKENDPTVFGDTVANRLKDLYRSEFLKLYDSKWRAIFYGNPALPESRRKDFDQLLEETHLSYLLRTLGSGNQQWQMLTYFSLQGPLNEIAPEYLETDAIIP